MQLTLEPLEVPLMLAAHLRYRRFEPLQRRNRRNGLSCGAVKYCHVGQPSRGCGFGNEHYSRGSLSFFHSSA